MLTSCVVSLKHSYTVDLLAEPDCKILWLTLTTVYCHNQFADLQRMLSVKPADLLRLLGCNLHHHQENN